MQILYGIAAAQMRKRWGSPARSKFVPGKFLCFGPFLGNAYWTSGGDKTDTLSVLIIHDPLHKPPKVSPIDPIYVLVFKNIGNGVPLPEIDALMVIIGNIGNGEPVFIVQGLLQDPLPLFEFGASATSGLSIGVRLRDRHLLLIYYSHSKVFAWDTIASSETPPGSQDAETGFIQLEYD
jgi:hypothetical protein